MKRVVFASLLALLIIGGVALAYFYHLRYRVSRNEPLGLVPPDACFIIESRNMLQLIEHIKENEPWKALEDFAVFGEAGRALRTVDSLSLKNEKLRLAL